MDFSICDQLNQSQTTQAINVSNEQSFAVDHRNSINLQGAIEDYYNGRIDERDMEKFHNLQIDQMRKRLGVKSALENRYEDISPNVTNLSLNHVKIKI